MRHPVQKRTVETRGRLIAAAQVIVAQSGYEALRVEDVVKKAGVAKGTFFAHFKDKDALMDLLIGTRIDACLDEIEKQPKPKDVSALTLMLKPLLEFMTCERYVFDVILRYSGAALAEEVGMIAMSFGRQIEVIARWLDNGPFRTDVSVDMLAEGVQAFAIQVMALHFCALHNDVPINGRLDGYLKAWLLPRDAL